jgi:hypothetical protein
MHATSCSGVLFPPWQKHFEHRLPTIIMSLDGKRMTLTAEAY